MHPTNKCLELKSQEYRELCNKLSTKTILNKENPLNFTGDRANDTAVLQDTDDKNIADLCLSNDYVFSLCNEDFWKDRLINKYGKYLGTENYIKNKYLGDVSWKDYYLWINSLVNDPNPYYVSANASAYNRNDALILLKAFRNVDRLEPITRNSVTLYEDPNGKKQGPYIIYNFKGKIITIGNYLNDKEEGKFDYFDSDGNITHSTNYRNGKLEGKQIFYKNGTPEIRFFRDDKEIQDPSLKLEVAADPRQCFNDTDPITLDNISDIDPVYLIKMEQNNKIYCFDIRAIYNWVIGQNKKYNPFNNVPFDKNQIDSLKSEADQRFSLDVNLLTLGGPSETIKLNKLISIEELYISIYNRNTGGKKDSLFGALRSEESLNYLIKGWNTGLIELLLEYPRTTQLIEMPEFADTNRIDILLARKHPGYYDQLKELFVRYDWPFQ